MKKTYLSIIVASAVVTISFTACGSSNSVQTVATPTATSTPSPVEAVVEKIDINVNCTTPPSINSYIELKKGDKIIKDEQNSTISIYHDENSQKRACLDRGIAHIEREE